jgi:plasmid stabilization system protein ParE
MRVRYRDLALKDLDGIFRYLDTRSPTGARNVLTEIHAAIAEIAANPRASRRTSDPAIRVKTLGRYRYKIFYSIETEEFVEIIHIRHAARRAWIPERTAPSR